MNKYLLLLGHIWTSPNTLLGLLVAGASFAQFKYIGKVCKQIYFVARPTSLTVRIMNWFNIIAITFGAVIIYKSLDEYYDDVVTEHELSHVRQYLRMGPFFLPLYLIGSLIARLAGQNLYRNNPFEEQAHTEEDKHERR